MSCEAKWIWNAETPASVPAGARISAGKFGRVARSLPIIAVASVNRPPASCMPSPESPANRTITRSRSSIALVMSSVAVSAPPQAAYGVYAAYWMTSASLVRLVSTRTRHACRGLTATCAGADAKIGYRLDLLNVDGLRALRPGLFLVGHLCALSERPVAVGLNARVVDE